MDINRLISWLFADRRSEWEKKKERQFIEAVNKLKNYSVSERGGLSIDPEEVREQVIAGREQCKHLVHRKGTPFRPVESAPGVQIMEGMRSAFEASKDTLDYVELATWRHLVSGSAVRYICLQSMETGKYAVATASLFSGGTDSLPPWIDANTNRQVASALRGSGLQWFSTVTEAMDAWDNSM